ncbi:MAG: divergent PAP2 family protein [bacterium]
MSIPYFIIIPVIVVAITQTIKFILKSYDKDTKEMEPNWRYLDDYGGMPSSHTAFMMSLLTIVLLHDGLNTITAAITTIITIVIIRDALGYRMYLQRHAEVLNKLIKRLPAEDHKNYPQHLEETVGHTIWEILVGGALGISISILLWYLLNLG